MKDSFSGAGFPQQQERKQEVQQQQQPQMQQQMQQQHVGVRLNQPASPKAPQDDFAASVEAIVPVSQRVEPAATRAGSAVVIDLAAVRRQRALAR